jgi:hypothetical protein
MGSTITIPKKEYQQLAEKALRFDSMCEIVENDLFSPPPTKDVEHIMRTFRNIGKYNKKFIEGLEKGLVRSLYFTNDTHSPSQPRNRKISTRTRVKK